jgi:uncharacterized protein YcgI (DUF1989 family)
VAERALREVVVPAAHGGAIEVGRGEYLSIVDLEGAQVADFVAIRRDDPRRFLSPHQTRSTLRRWTLRVGDRLVDNDREPVFEIVRDDVGVHDLFFCACSPALYRQRFGLTDHRSCRMNLLEALAPYRIEEWQLPDPINVFMRTPPRPDGEFEFHPAPSKAGDRLVLRAFADVVVAVSSCPMDLSPINGGRITPLKLAVAASPDPGRGPGCPAST